jgi:GntR family transcriptional regulator, vanillate catabolism transcriptional regulator
MSWLAAASSSRSLRWPTSWDAIEIRGVLEGTPARLAAERLTNDRELDPLRRLRDELDRILVRTIDSFARYLDLNEAPHTDAGRLCQESHVAVDDGTGSGSPVWYPSAWCLPAPSSPVPRRGSPWRMNRTGPLWKPSRSVRKPAESPAREHSLMSRRNLEAALDD